MNIRVHSILTPAVSTLDAEFAMRSAELKPEPMGPYSVLCYIGGALMTMGMEYRTSKDAMDAYPEIYWIKQGPGEYRSEDGRWIIRN